SYLEIDAVFRADIAHRPLDALTNRRERERFERIATLDTRRHLEGGRDEADLLGGQHLVAVGPERVDRLHAGYAARHSRDVLEESPHRRRRRVDGERLLDLHGYITWGAPTWPPTARRSRDQPGADSNSPHANWPPSRARRRA